jgi:hypothetical protein
MVSATLVLPQVIQQQETDALIEALANYCKSLEQQAVELRRDINRLTPKEQEQPFPDLHSDLYEAFDHLAAYAKFSHLLNLLE